MGQTEGGQVSPDGRWWWDGQAWQPIESVRREQPAVPDPRRPRVAVASLVLGCLSLVAWLLPIVGLPVSAMGLGLGVSGLGTTRRRMAVVGIVLAAIGLALTVANGMLGAYDYIRKSSAP